MAAMIAGAPHDRRHRGAADRLSLLHLMDEVSGVQFPTIPKVFLPLKKSRRTFSTAS
jgi:hypothetical protein